MGNVRTVYKNLKQSDKLIECYLRIATEINFVTNFVSRILINVLTILVKVSLLGLLAKIKV